jgi:N6-adenosine-specific RNA methylase IME4
MTSKKYSIVYADPPWDYKGQKMRGKAGVDSGGAINHYPCMKLPVLKKLPIQGLFDDNCLLFLWTSSPHLNQAIELLDAWGFSYATIGFIWDKVLVNPGFYTMSQCEICLIGKRKKGKIPSPRGARNIRQMVLSKRTKHSEKPSEVRQRIEEMFPTQNKIELFSRHKIPGWDAWGDEIISDINLNHLTV